MPNAQLLQWALWGFSLLAGVGVILAMFKLRYAERFLPHWNELKELEATLPFRREELRQTTEGIDKCRAEIGQLEATVGHLRILKEWQDANPEAPARIQQMITDLERCKSELAAIQQKLAEDEAKRNAITKDVSEFAQKKAELEGQIPILRDRLAALHKEDSELQAAIRALEERRKNLDQKVTTLANDVQAQETRLNTLLQQVEKAEQEKAAALRERDQARADRDAAKAELGGLQKSLEAFKAMAENLNARLKESDVGNCGGSKIKASSALKGLAGGCSRCLPASQRLRPQRNPLVDGESVHRTARGGRKDDDYWRDLQLQSLGWQVRFVTGLRGFDLTRLF
jgi:DNA repair exonuclease SbcCD ATPase subunit